MLDAFKNEIKVGDRVMYATHSSYGTTYVIGTISKLYSDTKYISPLDRVAVAPTITSNFTKFDKNPVVYASNVVLIPIG